MTTEDAGSRPPSPKRVKLDTATYKSPVDTTAVERDTQTEGGIHYRSYTLAQELSNYHAKGVTCVKFSPDRQWLATASADATARIAPLRPSTIDGAIDQAQILTLTGHAKGISDLSWTSDGRLLATASDDRTVRVWRVPQGKAVRVFRGHTNFVTCCSFSHSGSLLASGSFDETVRIWDVGHGTCLKTLPAHSDPVTAVDFCPDGTMLLTASHDGLVRIWDTQSGQCLKTLADGDASATAIGWAGFSPNGRYYLSCTLDSTVRLWDYVAAVPRKTYTGHVNVKYSSTAVVSNDEVVVGGDDGVVTVYNAQTKVVLQRLGVRNDALGDTNQPRPGVKAGISPAAAISVDRIVLQDGRRYIVVAYTDGKVRLYSATTSQS